VTFSLIANVSLFMKKSIFIALVILGLITVVSYSAHRGNVEVEISKRDTSTDSATVITTIEDESFAEPLSVKNTKASNGGALTVTALPTTETGKNYHVIRGVAPQNTFRMTVNDYTLRFYRPGQTTWNYIASTAIGTLKEGDNEYRVTAFDRAGEVIGSTIFHIVYSPPVTAPVLPGVGSPLAMTVVLAGLAILGWVGVCRKYIVIS
jgi:hypothetical protein